jgi:exodeoxyribonuclease VII small subunit
MIKNLENSLEELESIIEQLEKGEIPLGDSLSLFEKGVKLTKQCQLSLSEAEQKIQTMTEQQP